MEHLQKFNTENKSPCHDIAHLEKVDFEKPRQIQNSSYDFSLKPRFSSQWSLLGGLLKDFFWIICQKLTLLSQTQTSATLKITFKGAD